MLAHLAPLSVALFALCVVDPGCGAGFAADGGPDDAGLPPDGGTVDPCTLTTLSKLDVDRYGLQLWSPDRTRYLLNQKDATGITQVYVGDATSTTPQCITCTQAANGPSPDRYKLQVQWHPSGRWLILGVEQAQHDGDWYPTWVKEGFLESGVWLDIYAVTPDGATWTRLVTTTGGMTGPAFTPDGTKAAWAPIEPGDLSTNAFGVWQLHLSDFTIGADGTPAMTNDRDITPIGAHWVEPGNFAPDGKHLLISSDVGIANAQGQDQFVLDVETGALVNLTNTPDVWDEHGVFSPDGERVLFMSSLPYRDDPNASKTFGLKTEFFLMSAVDGSGLQQLTHFNEVGYPEYSKAVAANGVWSPDGSQIEALALRLPDYDTWRLTFAGKCGNSAAAP